MAPPAESRGGRGPRSLPEFLRVLEAHGELLRIRVPVSARFEIAEIVSRATALGGPAILFESVDGTAFPVAANLLGTAERIRLALGRRPGEIGLELASAAEALQPPSLGGAWRSRGVLLRGARARTRRVSRGACQQVSEEPDLTRLPILTSWPKDGGPFVTWPMVLTRHPATGGRNLGTYRMHVYDGRTTGMHMQIQKGGGFHLHEAEAQNRGLPACVVLGGDPALMLASIAPLPENIDELAFAAYLRGEPLPLVAARTVPLEVPASAEFILEGEVPPGERRLEGPFGDHFGHYSHAGLFPVFRLTRITRRREAILPVSVVGQPPQEDRYIGDALQEMMVPIAQLMHPEVRDLWAFYEAGFHNLLSISVRQRYGKEALKAAFGMLGTGQVSLSKVVVTIGPEANARDAAEVFREVAAWFEPAEDFLLLPGTAMDTLDFTSYRPNLGSKMILDATPRSGRAPRPLLRSEEIGDVRGLHRSIRRQHLFAGCILVVQIDGTIPPFDPDAPIASGLEPLVSVGAAPPVAATGASPGIAGPPPLDAIPSRPNGLGREVLERLLSPEAAAAVRGLEHVPMLCVVSEDVRLEDATHLLWGIFTRFDAARDVLFRDSRLAGAAPVHRGTLGIDATWKRGYPEPVRATDEIRRRVDDRWTDYGFRSR